MRSFLLAPLAVALLTECAPMSPPARACTLIGCTDGLTVELTGTPAGAYRVELEVPGEAQRRVVRCDSPGACGPVFFEVTPAVATVHVVTAAGTRSQEVRPAYQVNQPNGPDCPPRCRQARVTVAAA